MGFGFWASGFELRASGFELRASGFELRASGFEFWASGFEFWASGFETRNKSAATCARRKALPTGYFNLPAPRSPSLVTFCLSPLTFKKDAG